MRVGIIGAGAISQKHALAYRNIGFDIVACTDINPEAGRSFAAQHGGEFFPDYRDVCTFPDFRLEPLKACAESGKHIQVQKPIATNVATAREMIQTASAAGIVV